MTIQMQFFRQSNLVSLKCVSHFGRLGHAEVPTFVGYHPPLYRSNLYTLPAKNQGDEGTGRTLAVSPRVIAARLFITANADAPCHTFPPRELIPILHVSY